MTDTMNTYRTVTPYLIVGDAEVQLRFLAAAFGATEASVHRNPDGSVMHAEVTVGDSLVMLGQGTDRWRPQPATLFVWLPEVDAAFARALAAGATIESPVEDKPYGHRTGGVLDPNGNTWWIASPIA